jgi:hypothetical protein
MTTLCVDGCDGVTSVAVQSVFFGHQVDVVAAPTDVAKRWATAVRSPFTLFAKALP